MKTLYIFLCFLFLLSVQGYAQDPTLAGIPDANHVLVVYNSNSDTSLMVANYYRIARGIPTTNICPLDSLVSKDITIDAVTHRVIIAQETDIIRDSINHELNNGTKTFHAWRYYLDYVATPIRDWITAHNLTSTIRYIVLCKGVPFKIQANADGSDDPGNLTVDGLLCMLNTENYDSLITKEVYPNGGISNPYHNVDPNFTMEYRFLPDHFIAPQGHHLSYLVSHLDGISFDVVKSIIDKSLDPDMSGTAAWVIDGDLSKGEIDVNARDKLDELGFNVVYDNSDTWITSYSGKVMGYSSWGTHAEDGNCEWEDSAWVKDSLHFDLANGSVFNTYESFNGNSLTTLEWRYAPRIPPDCNHTQGLATQFTEIGGTGTMGHAWEPIGGIVQNQIFFPAYQMGYNLVDAFYQGLPALAWQNVLVADPLVRIYECENTVITTNTTIGSGDYECNVIVPQNVVLTVAPGSTINFRRNAALKVYGTLVINSNDTLNFNSYSKLVIDSIGSINVASGSYLNFYEHSNFILNNVFVLNPNVLFSFDDESVLQINNSFTIDDNAQLTMNDNSSLEQNGKLFVEQNAFLIMYNYSSLKNIGRLYLKEESNLNINSSSKLISYGGIYLSEGSSINQYNSIVTAINIESGVFIANGSANNPVNMICSSMLLASKLYFNNVDTLLFTYTNIDSGNIVLVINDGLQKPRLLSLSNSVITNSPSINSFTITNTDAVNITLADVSIFCNNANGIGLKFNGFNNAHILRSNIENIGIVSSVGIGILDNRYVEINECQINGFKDGIKQGRVGSDETEISQSEDIQIFNSDIIGLGNNQEGTGITVGYNQSHTTGVKIDFNNISDFTTCIAVNNPNNFPIGITNNIISNYGFFGISLNGGNEAIIRNNIITVDEPSAENPVGISVSQVNNPSILSNTINAEGVSNPGVGIFILSSGGEIRNNTIQYHSSGIELGSSSPNIGANTITHNRAYGIYISANSHPDLSEFVIGEEEYPVTGYNTVAENGPCEVFPNYSELYLIGSTANLENGCNKIADDRALYCDYFYLIDGSHVEETIQAQKNYWGELNDHNPEGRFGENITVDFEGYLDKPCTYSEGESFLLLANSNGEVFDTIYSSSNTPSEQTDIESRYAAANEYYYNNQYSQAKQEYEGIIQNYGSDRGSLQAHNRLYTIANLTNGTTGAFNQLKEFYLQKAGNQTDSLMVGTLKHLADLCLVSATEYIGAINNFDQEAQQNQNTDIALYRQIDALTTALLLPPDSSLNKGVLGKYCVKNLSDYTHKLSELLRTRGKSGIESKKDLLPTEYTLYQNYPNPFNPITTIKYDLPKASDVALIVYDILGRRVKQLVNYKQPAGRYEIEFDASTLASGVYIYQLIADKYINAKKMILLK